MAENEKSEQVKIPLEDRQEVENICLKITNLDLQRKLLLSDLEKAGKQLVDLQTKLKAKATELHGKYGVVLGRDQINDDGSFGPRQNGVTAQTLPTG